MTAETYAANRTEIATGLALDVSRSIGTLIDTAVALDVAKGEYYKEKIRSGGSIVHQNDILFDDYLKSSLSELVYELLEGVIKNLSILRKRKAER